VEVTTSSQIEKLNGNIAKPLVSSSLLGQVARLIKKQTNRAYFSEIPIGTKFIIVAEHNDMPAYELTGYFLNYPPQKLLGERYHFTGYIEKGSWEIVGSINDCISELSA
jgi:hypothetical protein